MNNEDKALNAISHKVTPDICAKPYRLTDSEIASLLQEMRIAGAWMQTELARRYPKPQTAENHNR